MEFLAFLQLKNVSNLLRHENAVLVHWFSNDAATKRDGTYLILIIWVNFDFSMNCADLTSKLLKEFGLSS